MEPVQNSRRVCGKSFVDSQLAITAVDVMCMTVGGREICRLAKHKTATLNVRRPGIDNRYSSCNSSCVHRSEFGRRLTLISVTRRARLPYTRSRLLMFLCDDVEQWTQLTLPRRRETPKSIHHTSFSPSSCSEWTTDCVRVVFGHI